MVFNSLEVMNKINPSPIEDNVLNKMSNPWTKPGTKEEGVEDLIFELNMIAAKKALGY